MNLAFLREAIELARQGYGRTSPNPMVGAVLERDGVVVGRGVHTYAGVKHAEVLAIEQAGEKARGATLYLNLEPCAHQGRTPPCAEALIAAGIRRVVAAMQDPNPRVSGQGFQRLREAGIDVHVPAEMREEAERLNEPFVHFMRQGRPLVTLKSAVTLDGKIAAPDDNEGWITSETARRHVQTIRHGADSILTGIGTVLADDCLLTDRTGLERSRPLLRIVADSQLRIPLHCKMVESCRGDVLVATTSAGPAERRRALEEKGVRVVALDGPGGRTNLQALVELLARENYLSLMIEAGSIMNWAALEAGIVDKVFLYYGAKILGGVQALPMAGGPGRRRRRDAIRVERLKLHPVAPDEFAVEAYVHRDY
jgi:diaminohydroxyphosphoribosylaminopyrimidine deaminase/5-amino-6-(5-phosphoribosylamino)uracil reductase